MIHDQGNSSDSSGFMIGILPAKEPHTVTNYPGQSHFSFSRGSSVYDSNNVCLRRPDTIKAHGTGDRVKFTVNPGTGSFSIQVNDNEPTTGEFNPFQVEMCFALGLYYTTQRVEITS